MALSGRDRTRYARHLLLAQLGEAGQERLLAARVRANGDADPGALAVTRCYLERAGLTFAEPDDAPARDGAAAAPVHVATSAEIDAMAGLPALHEAARALSGALSAVGTLLSVLGLSGSTLSGARVQPQIIVAISSEEA